MAGSTPPFPPPCKCFDCRHVYLSVDDQNTEKYSYIKHVSVADSRVVLKGFIDQIWKDGQFLADQCKMHGDRITSRWKKRSREQRATWIRRADPTLHEDRWFLPRFKYATNDWKEARKYRKSFLLPYLSLELLKMEPNVFLSLLYGRTSYPPQSWASVDNKEFSVSWESGYLDIEFSEGSVVMHGDQYGWIVPWDAAAVHRGDTMPFPRAQLILEAQACLMRFLRNLVDQVLEEADIRMATGHEKLAKMATEGFRKSGDQSYWSIYTHKPYSPPPKFNIDNYIVIVEAMMVELSDHLWFLQTDPSYIRRYVQLIRQNSAFETLNAVEGHHFVVRELYHDTCNAWFWESVLHELYNAREWRDHYKDKIATGQPLPPEYDQALGALEVLLFKWMRSLSTYLQHFIPQRPGFNRRWDLTLTTPGRIEIKRREPGSWDDMIENDQLEWCLILLVDSPDERLRFDSDLLARADILFDFLDEYLAHGSAKERARVDELLFTKLSNYAAISEMLLSLRLERPQNTVRSEDEIKNQDDRVAWKFFVNLPYDQPFEVEKPIAVQLKHFFDIGPLSGPKDESSLRGFDKTHEALAAFWEAFSSTIAKGLRAQGNIQEEYIAPAIDLIAAHKSDEHRVTYLIDRQIAVNEIHARRIKHAKSAAEATLFPATDDAGDTSNNVKKDIHQPKAKVKTRRGNVNSSEVSPAEDVPEQPKRKLTVSKKRTLDVLKAMFPVSGGKPPKSIDWDSFVQAMADAGFKARNNGGSGVIFSNETESAGNAGGRIIFHKPHPVSKIDPVMLHSWGRRMNKWFGWHRALFVLASS